MKLTKYKFKIFNLRHMQIPWIPACAGMTAGCRHSRAGGNPGKSNGVNLSNMDKKKGHLTLLLLCCLFTAPFLLACGLYFFRDSFSFKPLAKGEILSPYSVKEVFNVAFLEPMGKWQLLYLSSPSCDKHCQTHLQQLQNLCIALGKDESRVIVQTLSLPENHFFKKALSFPFVEGSVILIDPKGFLVTHYPPQALQAKGILDDLRRLLRYSYVG